MKNYFQIIISIAFSIFLIACNNRSLSTDICDQISLNGYWNMELDTANTGIAEKWYTASYSFTDSMHLPGTTDTNQKGFYNWDTSETTHLSRTYKYVGKVWYKKQIEIPESWKDKHIKMVLERTKPTQIWIDGKKAGSSDDISTAQTYDLTEFMTPGKHHIAIMVDNGVSVPEQLLSNSHAYTESTQTNWNGIIGELYLEAKSPLHIQTIQVYPDAKNKFVQVKLCISNPELIEEDTQVEISAEAWNTSKKHRTKKISYNLNKSTSEYTFVYSLGTDALLWSEFDPALYNLQVSIKNHDLQTVSFGLRDFGVNNTQFTINERTIFLRGKHDACVFPLTGHAPMDVETWRNYFQTCKKYGINHCRFHSWCPPKACFEAADIEGIYLQPELPFWGALKREDKYLCSFLLKEGINIQNEYGNHASFVMFALGNELSGDLDVMQEFTQTFRQLDDRHLYAFGSNNFLGFEGQVDGEDFLVTCRIGGADDYSTHTRGSFSFADAEQGGYINNTYPNSEIDFLQAISDCTVPVISHETGQFQVYPNYSEMKKYTGLLRPDNLGMFRQRLDKAGMLDQAEDFFKASGRWSAMLYKADIEMDLRTKGFGGFQLLDLQDYPGQGSAFVGILDAFMENKGIISSEEWKEFCNDVVPLFVTEKFCWTTNETLTGKIKIANYSEVNLQGKTLKWKLKSASNNILDKGELKIANTKNGLLEIGTISPKITSIAKAEKVSLVISISDTEYKNRYPLWIYPSIIGLIPGNDITIAKKMDKETIQLLSEGGKILWFPQREKIKAQTVDGLFQTDYWNYRMFKGICEWLKKPASPGTLGILTTPEHPLFSDFPTDFHTNWQWYPIIKESYPFILNRLPADYRPIVQVIDNVERNYKLGLIFEFKVNKGKLLVCMSNLDAVLDKPETMQLYVSMLNYMDSDSFNPTSKLSVEKLVDLFTSEIIPEELEELKNISYD